MSCALIVGLGHSGREAVTYLCQEVRYAYGVHPVDRGFFGFTIDTQDATDSILAGHMTIQSRVNADGFGRDELTQLRTDALRYLHQQSDHTNEALRVIFQAHRRYNPQGGERFLVYVLANLSDPLAAALIVDVAFWLRQAIEFYQQDIIDEQSQGATRVEALCVSVVFPKAKTQTAGQWQRAAGVMKELKRFSRVPTIPQHPGLPDEMGFPAISHRLIDLIWVVQQTPNGSRAIRDYWAASLLAQLDPWNRDLFVQRINNYSSDEADIRRTRKIKGLLVHTIDVRALKFPKQHIVRGLVSRLVNDATDAWLSNDIPDEAVVEYLLAWLESSTEAFKLRNIARPPELLRPWMTADANPAAIYGNGNNILSELVTWLAIGDGKNATDLLYSVGLWSPKEVSHKLYHSRQGADYCHAVINEIVERYGSPDVDPRERAGRFQNWLKNMVEAQAERFPQVLGQFIRFTFATQSPVFAFRVILMLKVVAKRAQAYAKLVKQRAFDVTTTDWNRLRQRARNIRQLRGFFGHLSDATEDFLNLAERVVNNMRSVEVAFWIEYLAEKITSDIDALSTTFAPWMDSIIDNAGHTASFFYMDTEGLDIEQQPRNEVVWPLGDTNWLDSIYGRFRDVWIRRMLSHVRMGFNGRDIEDVPDSIVYHDLPSLYMWPPASRPRTHLADDDVVLGYLNDNRVTWRTGIWQERAHDIIMQEQDVNLFTFLDMRREIARLREMIDFLEQLPATLPLTKEQSESAFEAHLTMPYRTEGHRTDPQVHFEERLQKAILSWGSQMSLKATQQSNLVAHYVHKILVPFEDTQAAQLLKQYQGQYWAGQVTMIHTLAPEHHGGMIEAHVAQHLDSRLQGLQARGRYTLPDVMFEILGSREKLEYYFAASALRLITVDDASRSMSYIALHQGGTPSRLSNDYADHTSSAMFFESIQRFVQERRIGQFGINYELLKSQVEQYTAQHVSDESVHNHPTSPQFNYWVMRLIEAGDALVHEELQMRALMMEIKSQALEQLQADMTDDMSRAIAIVKWFTAEQAADALYESIRKRFSRL